MSEGSEAGISTTDGKEIMPFYLHDIKLRFELSSIHPILNPLDKVRKELKFMTLLAYSEWDKQHLIALCVGTLAFLIGSISVEIFSGGNQDFVGMAGLKKIGSFSFFQMLLSIIAWVWFIYLIWIIFPVMRIHSISMLLMWNGLMFLQVLFHQKNPQFPAGIVLADMMYGILILLVILFFMYFFWKAVIETRDLHVHVHHVHEDVRIMEQEMSDHSLLGWASMLIFWLVNTFYSSWCGVHYVASSSYDNHFVYVMHLVSGVLIVPVFMLLVWYPQRMLGSDARISTTAAITAEIELKQGNLIIANDAKCAECGENVEIMRESNGQISVPCSSEGCITFGIIGTACTLCKVKYPTRFECKSCGANLPFIDCVPDMEAW